MMEILWNKVLQPQFGVIALFLAIFSADALAEGVSVSEAYARATPPGMQMGAIYLTITNKTDHSERLLQAKTPAAQAVELHSHQMTDGVAQMRQVDEIKIPARRTVHLQPGGYHLMLVGLTKPLLAGSRLPVTLEFAKAGTITTQFEVRSLKSR